MPARELLKQANLFSGLSEEELAQLAGFARRKEYEPGALIVAQNTQGDEIFTIAVGSVEVFVRGYQDERSLVVLGSGQVFGELALIGHGFRSASVRANEEGCICYVLTVADVNALCANNTEIGYTIMRNLASELAFKLRHGNLAIA